MRRARLGSGGSILIAVTFMMLVLVMMGITGVSMLVNQAHTSISVQRIAQAAATRHGVSEFLQRRLQYDLDWSNAQDETIMFNGYTTQVEYGTTERNTLQVSTVTTDEGGNVMRRQSFSVDRVPTSMRFSLFVRSDQPTTFSNTTISSGDIYSKGRIYLTQNSNTGSGVDVYSGDANGPPGYKRVDDPQPKMPNYDAGSSAAKVIPVLDAAIAAAASEPDLILTNATFNLTSDHYCNNLIVRGASATITGSGKIVAAGNVYFQDETEASCIVPVSGDYVTSDGGCKEVATRLVWFEEQTAEKWGDAQSACAAAGRRLPSPAEMALAIGDGAFKFDVNQELWSSDAYQSVHMTTGAGGDYSTSQDTEIPFVCVRTASAGESANRLVRIVPSGTDASIAIAAGGAIYKTDDKTILITPAASDLTNVIYAKTGPLHLTSPRYAGNPFQAVNTILASGGSIYIGPRSVVTRAIIYATSGTIDIQGDGTPGNAPSITGIVSSMSEADPALRIRDVVNVEGVIYSNGGDARTGTVHLHNVSGSNLTVLVNKFHNNSVDGLVIAEPYEGADVMPGPATVLEGFTGTISRTRGSWTGD